MEYFSYGEIELDYLKSKDKKLASVIDKIGFLKRTVREDLFYSLIHSIVGQQISSKALNTITKRIVEKLHEITPETILSQTDEELQSVGLSFKKVGYMKNIAQKVYDGEIDLTLLKTKSDNEVIETLSQFKGIGVWTAEMIMIHSMQRKNILSYGDLAIVKGIRMLYGHREVDKVRFEKYRKRFSPYCSIASFYFWEISGRRLPELMDKGRK